MRAQINSLTDQSVALRTNTEALKADEQNIKSKIERKQLELERAEKRLRSMKKVKYEPFLTVTVTLLQTPDPFRLNCCEDEQAL